MKREIGIFVALTVMNAGLFNGCGQSNEPNRQPELLPPPPSPTRSVEPMPTPVKLISVETEWRKLSPLERVKRIERNQNPAIAEFNPLKELSLAVAEVHKKRTNCEKSVEEMAGNVRFLKSDAFTEAFERSTNQTLSSQEKESFKENSEFITGNKQILFNIDLLDKDVDANRKIIAEKAPQLDPKWVVYKAALLHAFSHLNLTDSKLDFYSAPIFTTIDKDTYIFGALNGFIFEGTQNGKEYRGAALLETIVELSSRLAGTDFSDYMPFRKNNYLNTDYLMKLHIRAGISQDDFLQYSQGKKPFREYLRRLSGSNEMNGLRILALLDLAFGGEIKIEEVDDLINKIQEQKNPSPTPFTPYRRT